MTQIQSVSPIEILLIEDNLGDVELTQEVFSSAPHSQNIHVARDGEEALEFLYQRGVHADAARPDLILLDLNMPRMNGREVLMIIKKDDALKNIPVIVFTSSQAPNDIAQSYALHANAYIVKPVSLVKFFDIVEAIEKFWFGVVSLPPRLKSRR